MNLEKDISLREDNILLDNLIQGEMSAKEVYDQVLKKINKELEVQRLKEFKKDHLRALSFWEAQGTTLEDHFTSKFGIWRHVAKTLVGTGQMLGNKATLLALKEGEEFGLRQYQKALKSNDLSTFQKSKIRNSFIPNQIRHISTLNAIIRNI